LSKSRCSRTSLVRKSNVLVVNLILTITVITFRRVSVNLEHFQLTNGSCNSVGHRIKTHRITPATVNERGDIEIKDYVILPHVEDDRLPPSSDTRDGCHNDS
jgi:hypothetical protein